MSKFQTTNHVINILNIWRLKAPHLVHVHERGAGVRGQGGGGGEDGEQEGGRGLQHHGEAARGC